MLGLHGIVDTQYILSIKPILFILKIMRLKLLLLVFCVAMSIIGCGPKKVFLGELETFTLTDDTISVRADSVPIELYRSFCFAVHDSLFFSYVTTRNENCLFKVFHAETGELLGSCFPYGHGSGEYLAVSPIMQLYEDEGQLKSLIYAPNENKLMKWNVTKSVRTGKTVCDEVIDGIDGRFSRFFYLGNETILTYIASVHISADDRITQSKWQVRTYPANELVKEFAEYQSINNKKSKIILENFFYVFSGMKPDMKRMVEAMLYLPQINIMNTDKAESKGYLMKGSDGYSIFHSDMAEAKEYYWGVQADDKNIFALWFGKKNTEENYVSGADELHVFDWNGNMVKRVKLSSPVHYMSLDTSKGIIYGWNQGKDKVYRYRVGDMNVINHHKHIKQ